MKLAELIKGMEENGYIELKMDKQFWAGGTSKNLCKYYGGREIDPESVELVRGHVEVEVKPIGYH